MEFWFITTDHLSNRIWFRDDEDFMAGMNLVAVLAVALNVSVIAFILMSNHVHFVVRCSEEKAHQFIEEYKKRYSQYVNKKYGTKDLLRRVRVKVDPIDGNDESFEWIVAYVHMNPVAAGICLNFNDYRWGTGGSFFKTSPLQGRCLGTFSKRGRIALLHSKQEMPPHFLVGGDGYILPGSYVQVEMVETIFRTPRRMNYFHQNSSKAKRRLTSGEPDMPSFRDQLVQSAIPDLCRALFRKASLQALTNDELAELLKQLRYRFSSNVNQLMRVTGLTYVQLTELLSKV